MSGEFAIYGTLIEFSGPEALTEAARAVRKAGFRNVDAYTPFPVEEMSDAIGFKRDGVALIGLLGGIGGGLAAYLMQWYSNVIDYPINIAGRPLHSWPAFIPVTFELTVLGASLSAAFGMLALNRLPMPWHPVFNHPGFLRASTDRFFLCIETSDPLYDHARIRDLLGPFHPLSIHEVSAHED